MSDQTLIINSKTVSEREHIGAFITGEMEAILLRDPTSLRHKEFQTAFIQSLETEMDLDYLAHELAANARYQKEIEAHLEEEVLAQRREEDDLVYQRSLEPQKPGRQPEISSSIENSSPNLANLLIALLRHNKHFISTTHMLQTIQNNQQALRQQWHAEQIVVANRFIENLRVAPVLLPNGMRINHTLDFNPSSPEALELAERLAAMPMTAEIVDRLTNTDVRDLYNKQVHYQQKKLLHENSTLANDPDKLDLIARDEAIKELKLDARQLQNKFIMSIPVIHKYLLDNKGPEYLQQLIHDYNKALKIDPVTQPHKQVGIFKILNDAIAPLLAPKLVMQPKRNKLKLDDNDLNTQFLKSRIQQDQQEKMKRAQLHSIQALVATFRAMATENGDLDFLNDICNRLSPSALQKMKTSLSTKLKPKWA